MSQMREGHGWAPAASSTSSEPLDGGGGGQNSIRALKSNPPRKSVSVFQGAPHASRIWESRKGGQRSVTTRGTTSAAVPDCPSSWPLCQVEQLDEPPELPVFGQHQPCLSRQLPAPLKLLAQAFVLDAQSDILLAHAIDLDRHTVF